MKIQIIPTIFAHNKLEFNERLNKLLTISENLHIDFMDGKFVKSKSISIKEIPDLKKYKNNFEAHLMTKNPEKSLVLLKKKGFKKIILHLESSSSVEKVIRKAESLRLQIFIAINPETSASKILPFIHKVHGVLIMGVHPGKEHQSLIPSTLKKIQALREFNSSIVIQIDGGVNEKTAIKLKKAGADILNSGSFISDSNNPKESLKKLNQ